MFRLGVGAVGDLGGVGTGIACFFQGVEGLRVLDRVFGKG